MTLQPNSSSTSDTEYIPFDTAEVESSKSEGSQSEGSLCVTIAPCPPPVTTKSTPITSQPSPATSTPPTSTTQPPPVYTDTTTTTTTGEPLVNVNTSDTGANTLGFVTSTTTPPVSPQPGHTFEDHIGGDGLDFDTFHYSPFSIQENSDDNAYLTQRHLKELNTKLDTLLASAIASTSHAYSEATVKNMLDTLVKEHVANLEKENKAVEDSTLLN
ncbi:uncharacterized protein PB18E9.04c-like [Lactuca sativa]|uniref:uncharacterized protein PB18E9.04c-like n=1 Tax=Lactuca sativa TaxID=4236 RepID=UPI000CD96918|nr:uncharacterized protein PB18E9.04c-like [Lactuca sativa]